MKQRIARVAAVALVMGLSACSVVGYPAGSPGAPPTPGAADGDGSASANSDGSGLDIRSGDPVPMAEPRSERGNPESYEVFGETYYVSDSADGYDEIGIASWYGDAFSGRPTSSGETFDPRLLTAAHRSLPLPTWVEVTHLENERSVVVRVNDRGPFHDTERRIIDLSEAAARRLGMIASGTARVRVRALSEDELRGRGGSELLSDTVATFSVVGFDPITGEVGVAVQSRVFSVGNGVIWGEAGVGVVATQAVVDVSYGPKGLELLRQGLSPEAVVERLLAEDPDPRPEGWSKQGRQVSVMDAEGRVATHTGPEASDWAGHRVGQYVSAQGNILAGPEVVDEMVRAFEETEGRLALRLMAALDAGQAAGGDRRGVQSAAMLVVREDGGVWLNNDVVLRLQVDDHEQPLAELRRLVERASRRPPRR